MKRPFVRWWMVFWGFIFITLFALWAGGSSFILEHDATNISWLILSIFSVGSIHLGYYVTGDQDTVKDYKVTEFFIQTCSGLGVLGTIIGLIISMVGSFDGIDTSDQESIKAAISMFASGMGAALTTTLVGLGCALMLEGQLIAVRGKWKA